MDTSTIGVPLAFFAMMVVLCWCVVAAKGYWWLKLILVAVTLCVSLLLWKSVSSMGGWATNEKLPDRFLVHWVEIQEPDASGKNPGFIMVWATELVDDNNVKKTDSKFRITADHPGEPRVYRLAYKKDLHQQMSNVKQRLKQGKPVVGRRKGLEDGEDDGDDDGDDDDGNGDGKGKSKGKGKGKGKGKIGAGGEGGFSKEQEFMFYVQPPGKMPDKIPSK